jgi:hypothetical protein
MVVVYQNNKGGALVKIKISNENNKNNNTTTTTILNVCNHNNIECLYPMFTNHHICVVLQFSIYHIGGWKCPKFVHKFKKV